MPVKTATAEELIGLSADLYPTGRAFNMPNGSNLNNLHRGINMGLQRLIEAGAASLDSTFPDNENFNSADADLWEYRFGIPYNATLSIEERRAVLLRKMSFPQNIKARQGYRYVENQLQQAGFAVHVYENVFFDVLGHHYYLTPADILGTQPTGTQHGGGTQHGDATQHGGGNYAVIANSAEPNENYSTGGNLWATFFIAGDTLNSIATVPASRQREFRELVLKLKPAHLVGFLFVNFL
jgi:hypothetical protein